MKKKHTHISLIEGSQIWTRVSYHPIIKKYIDSIENKMNRTNKCKKKHTHISVIEGSQMWTQVSYHPIENIYMDTLDNIMNGANKGNKKTY